VAGEMPGMVQSAVEKVDGVKSAHVELVWEPAWTPALMAETAKLTLNMY
jgi:metal-sulfur cluster biosynthetic enzyme